MGAYQMGGEKSIQFFQTVQRPVRWSGPRSPSMITRVCCTSFSKAPASDVVVAFVFHLLHALQEILKPSHVCSSWASYSCNVTPLPTIPHTVLMHPRNSFSVPSIVSVVSPPLPRKTHVSIVPQRRHRTGSGEQAFQPFSLLPSRSANAVAPISVYTNSSGI